MKKLLIVIALGLISYAVPGPQSVLFALTFGPDSETRGTQLDAIVAIVNDDVITRRELNTATNTIEQRIRQKGTPAPSREELEKQVLEHLILTKLQLREVERNGIVVDDPTLNAALENLARQSNLTLSQLRETVEKDGLSFADFREEIHQELLFTRLRQRMVDSHIQISEQAVNDALASSSSLPGSAAPADAEYHIAHILIALPEGASPEQIDAAQQKARRVLEQLHQGADFKRLAVTVSNAPQALEGGDLGWRTAEQLPTLFVDVVPRLQPGQVSDLIRSPSGFHIVKLLEVRSSAPEQMPPTQTQGSAAPSRDKLRENLFKRRVEEEWDMQLRRWRDEAYVEVRLPKAQTGP